MSQLYLNHIGYKGLENQIYWNLIELETHYKATQQKEKIKLIGVCIHNIGKILTGEYYG